MARFRVGRMNIRFLPQRSDSAGRYSFEARHPMYQYEVPAVPTAITDLLKRYEKVVVVGMGGSVFSLKVLTDFFGLQSRVLFLDSVDPARLEHLPSAREALYCVVSKSGETLEIRSLLAELMVRRKMENFLIVTDPAKGWLRTQLSTWKFPSLEIPPELGGRFTNFTVFHRALLERWGVQFETLITSARSAIVALKKNPAPLAALYDQIFSEAKSGVVLWAYGDHFLGLAEWTQQILAESLGKKSSDGRRCGLLPTVLKGPQDQHSVLQLFMDGPQSQALWFFRREPAKDGKKRNVEKMPENFKDLTGIVPEKVLGILAESTIASFEERLSSKETCQPLTDFQLVPKKEEELGAILAMLQAFIEYSADRLKINAYDQPGVERGKSIAREILTRDSL